MKTVTITERLHAAGQRHRGTDLGALLQAALLHIKDRDHRIAALKQALAEKVQKS